VLDSLVFQKVLGRFWLPLLESIHSFDVLLLAPVADTLEVDVAKCLATFDEVLFVNFVKALLYLGVLRLLQEKHAAG